MLMVFRIFGGRFLRFASERLRDCREVVSEAMRCGPSSFIFASKRLRYTKSVVEECLGIRYRLDSLHKDEYILAYTSEQICDDKSVVIACVTKNPKDLQYASDRLKDDKDVVMAAASKDPRSLNFASPRLRGDYDVAILAASYNGEVLCILSPELRNNRDIVKTAVRKIGISLRHASEELRDDEEIVYLSMKTHMNAFAYASDRIRSSKEIFLKFDKEHAIKYASANLLEDHDVARMVLGRCGYLLYHFPEAIRDCEEFVELATRYDESALKFSSERIREKLNKLSEDLTLGEKFGQLKTLSRAKSGRM